MRHKTKYNDEDDLEKGKNDHFKTQLSNYWRQRHTPSNQSETIDKSDGKSSSDCDIHKHVTNKSSNLSIIFIVMCDIIYRRELKSAYFNDKFR